MKLSTIRKALLKAMRPGDFVTRGLLRGREQGGLVHGAEPSLVGEEGPELVKWGGNGFVTPADLTAAMFLGHEDEER